MLHEIYLLNDTYPKIYDERYCMDKIPYASVIWTIMNAMLYTRSYISFAISVTSKFKSNPDKEHWIVVKSIPYVLEKK